MAIQSISRAQAFGAGAQLWIIPNAKESTTLLRRVDWYLNFQLSRANLHEKKPLAPALQNVMTENNLSEFSPKVSDKAALAVIAGDRLTADLVVELPFSTPSKWFEEIHAVWQKFDKPRLRVFLPDSMTANQVGNLWPGSKSDDFSVVTS